MTQRIERVQKLARQVLGEAIQELKDPRIGFATVTAVKVTPDLRFARVYVSVLGSADDQQQTLNGLKSAGAHLRSELGRQMRVKYTPELSFELDTQAEEAQRLEALFRQIRDQEEA